MRALTGKAFCRLLERHNWQLKRIKGSRHIYAKDGIPERISVPVHDNKTLKRGLQSYFMKISRIEESEL